MDQLLIQALIAGIGIALCAGPISCFILWQRMANFGDTLSHSALLAIILASVTEFNISITIMLVCSFISFCLIFLKNNHNNQISTSSYLAILSHGSVAISLILISLIDNVRINLSTYLFSGDILSLEINDIVYIYVLSLIICLWLFFKWRKLILAILMPEMAHLNGINIKTKELEFSIIISVIIAIFIKFIGVLLIASMLIIPGACARILSKSPKEMLILSTLTALCAFIIGINASYVIDIPTGPTIVATALSLFVISHVFLKLKAISKN